MYSLLLVLTLGLSMANYAQTVTIPDVNFKNALVNDAVVDMDGDYKGEIDLESNEQFELV